MKIKPGMLFTFRECSCKDNIYSTIYNGNPIFGDAFLILKKQRLGHIAYKRIKPGLRIKIVRFYCVYLTYGGGGELQRVSSHWIRQFATRIDRVWKQRKHCRCNHQYTEV